MLREAGLVTGERRAVWVSDRVVPARVQLLADVLVPAGADRPNAPGPRCGAGAEASA